MARNGVIASSPARAAPFQLGRVFEDFRHDAPDEAIVELDPAFFCGLGNTLSMKRDVTSCRLASREVATIGARRS
jgi:hypothetical protein